MNNAVGRPSMHVRRIRMGGDANTNPKERGNCTLMDLVESCGGLKSLDTTYVGMHQHLQRRKAARGNRPDAPHGCGGGLH